MQTISKQLFSKHFSAAFDTNAAVEEWCFLCGPFQDDISKQLLVGAGCRSVE
jgi:hypothetical protein